MQVHKLNLTTRNLFLRSEKFKLNFISIDYRITHVFH